jgi:hypothetical protein
MNIRSHQTDAKLGCFLMSLAVVIPLVALYVFSPSRRIERNCSEWVNAVREYKSEIYSDVRLALGHPLFVFNPTARNCFITDVFENDLYSESFVEELLANFIYYYENDSYLDEEDDFDAHYPVLPRWEDTETRVAIHLLKTMIEHQYVLNDEEQLLVKKMLGIREMYTWGEEKIGFFTVAHALHSSREVSQWAQDLLDVQDPNSE